MIADFWAAGFWQSNFWAPGFWGNQDALPTSGGGWVFQPKRRKTGNDEALLLIGVI